MDPVAAYGGLRLIPQATLEEASPFDVFIVPGTISVEREDELVTVSPAGTAATE